MVLSIAALLSALTFSFFVSVDATERGLGWATDNAYAPVIGSKPRVTWYHHWEMGPVPQMPSKNEYVPMFWGPSKWNLWDERLAEMKKKTPKHLMAFNEPDVPSQSHMDPNYAAELFIEQIYPWSKKGTQLGSPAIVWDLNWMATFLSGVEKKGGHVDFICLHWYGSWNDLAGFKSFVTTTHSRFGKNIWITEIGITSASHPSQSQVKNFLMDALSWLDSQPYAERAAWFGSFEVGNPPDDFATGLNAFFNNHGEISDMGYWYVYSSQPDKRSLRSRHHRIARNNATTDPSPDHPVHCDDWCHRRNSQIEAYLATLPAPPPPTTDA